MKRSKNGQWVIEDNRFQYMCFLEEACIAKIVMYSLGFNSISVIYTINGKQQESTWPRDYFKRISFKTIEDAMANILKSTVKSSDIDTNQRLYEYKHYLEKKYPEKLI